MDYPAGNITTNTGKSWVRHSGSSGDSMVVNYAGSPAAATGKRFEVNQSRSDDVHRWFTPDTNGFSSGALYASFIVSVTNLPSNPGGAYFAHFMDTNISFRTRAFTVVPANPYPFTNSAAGTFRFGVANAAADYSNGSGGPTGVVPLDLALNTDYQVVLRCDMDNVTATMWVNAASELDAAVSSPVVFDAGPITNALAAFAFRQASGEGVLEIRDVAVGQSFADVMTNTPALAKIGLQPVNLTNFAGNAAILEVAASGMGLAYQWMKDGVPVNGGTGQLLLFDPLQASHQGSYICKISNSAGDVDSAAAYVSVDSTATPPTFTTQPANTTNSVGETITLTAVATGTGPLSYQWKRDGVNVMDGPSGLAGDTSVTSGAQSPYLKIASVSTNQAGVYTAEVVGGAGTRVSSPATLTIVPPRPVTIAYLRSLFDTSTWQPTDKTTLFNITGVITTYTNTTSGSTSSYYVQDETAGINLFVTGTGAANFRPQFGDKVTASGTLLSFQNNLELQCLASNPYQTYSVLSRSNALPAPKVVSIDITNDLAATELVDGSLVMFTNVYFISNSITTANRNMMATNSAGKLFLFFFPASQDQDLRNRSLPSFAWTVTGIMNRFNNIWECMVTRYADVVGTAPLLGSTDIVGSDDGTKLSWATVPFGYSGSGYSYSVYGSTNVAGPYLPVATGLTFPNTVGSFSPSSEAPMSFYKISSP